MNARPFLRSTIVELEDLYAAKRTDADTLNALMAELQFRNVPRAIALLAKVKAALSGETPLTPSAQPELFTPSSLPLASPLPPPQPPAGIFPKPIPKSLGREPEAPTMALDEAYKILRVTAGSPWEQVEQARAMIVQRSHPDSILEVSPEKRSATIAEARLANAAYVALQRARSQ